jgi:CubicO group peptidase (beta-lactamase class C family)
MTLRALMFLAAVLPAAAQPVVHVPDAQKLQQILKDFEVYAEQGRKDWQVPGMAIAIVADDKVIYAKGFGVKRVGGTDPVDPHTVFPIGSASKAFTSALVAMMADEGKLKWSDPVLQHDPDFQMYDPWVTREFQIQDLMAQHSGMPPYANDWLGMAGFPSTYIAAQMKYVKPSYSFREGFSYVNNLFIAAADVIEKKTGKSWSENVHDRIFEPLGMTESSTNMEAFRAAKNATSLHKMQDGKVVAREKDDTLLNWTDNLAPAGAINSTVLDMMRWAQLQMTGNLNGKQLITAGNIDFLHRPQTVLPKPPDTVNSPLSNSVSSYCEGWVRTESRPYPMIWHNGDSMFMHAAIGIAPGGKLGIVVLTNLGGIELPESLMFKFYDMYFGNLDFDWSGANLKTAHEALKAAVAAVGNRAKTAAPPMNNAAYLGVFHNQAYGDFTIAEKNGSLHVTAGKTPIILTLTPWDRDTFLINWPSFDAFPGESGFLRFVIDRNGQASAFVGDQFADVDGGRFTRVAQP